MKTRQGNVSIIPRASYCSLVTVCLPRFVSLRIPYKYPGLSLLDYLATPLTLDRSHTATWQLTIRRIQARLANWRGGLLSPVGRRILIQSVTTAIPLYWLSHNHIPGKVTKEISRMNAAFLWSGHHAQRGLHPLAWGTVTRPLPEGGLGVRDIEVQSKALLSNLVWRFFTQPNSFWGTLLAQKYLRFSTFRTCHLTPRIPPFGGKCCSLGITF